jgi:hypothetical protein
MQTTSDLSPGYFIFEFTQAIAQSQVVKNAPCGFCQVIEGYVLTWRPLTLYKGESQEKIVLPVQKAVEVST